jgi:hypothetical protein
MKEMKSIQAQYHVTRFQNSISRFSESTVHCTTIQLPIMPTAIATLSTPRDELMESLEKHNATFTKLLSLIPARFYLPPDQDELDSRWMKNKKRRTGEEIKEHKRKAKADKVSLYRRERGDMLMSSLTLPTI